MKVESITVRNAGPFTEEVSVGPLDGGLNVLAARNEAGKSTLLLAAARALFDRHTVSGESIESLRPAGTSLAPEITVVFVTAAGRFRIRKRFLNSPTSELSESRGDAWQPLGDGDAADRRVLELIGGTRSGRGVSRAEHWGLLRYLWARQGETADWPAWEDEAGMRVRTGLARVDIDPLVDRLGRRLHDVEAEQFTARGRVAKNSPLSVARQTVAQLESDVAGVRAKMDQIEAQSQALEQLRAELAVRGREQAETEAQARALTEALKQAELLQKDLERFESDFAAVRQRLATIHGDRTTLQEADAGLETATRELAEQQAAEDHARQAEHDARRAVTELQDQAKALQVKLDCARKREARLREIQELRRLDRDLEARRKRLAAVEKQQHTLDQLRRKRAGCPTVTAQQIQGLEELERILRELTIRVETVGLRVVLTPRHAGPVAVERDDRAERLDIGEGKSEALVAARRVRITVPDWGRIEIDSGAEEAVALEQEVEARRTALDEELKAIGAASVDAARTIFERVKDLDRQIETAGQRCTELLADGDGVDALVAAVEALASDLERSRARLNLDATEAGLAQAEVKAELAAIQTTLDADGATWASVQKALEAQAQRLESSGRAREGASQGVNAAKRRIAALQAQMATIKERYPDGIDVAEERAQAAFVEAKAQRDVARKKMPEEWTKLGARHDRALRAAEQAAREYHELEQRAQRVETLLEHAGSAGLYSRETRIQEALARAEADAARWTNRAMAARCLAGLIDYRKKAAVSTVLKPLEDQLSATFAEITGVQDRRVFLDENLQVIGIGRSRAACYPFTRLSQGAREQLLLALRAAVALELGREEPQILILDDVLVNTDAPRQANVLDFIGSVARHAQVLIVTCHGERYRGMGTALRIRTKSRPEGGRSPAAEPRS